MAELSVELSVEVDANCEEIWQWMSEVEKWNQWTPFIISASYIKGNELKEGAKFKFKPSVKPFPINLKATVTESSSPHLLTWEGSLPALKARHTFEFVPLGGGKTKVISREKFTGLGLFFFKLFFPKEKLEQLHSDWLKAIQQKSRAC
jgi:hypothetical protein